MALKIKANTFATQRWLEVQPAGIVFCETSAFGGKKQYLFHQIDCVLLSPQNVLSIQVGMEVMSLPVKYDKPAHRQVIDALMSGLQRQQSTGGFPVTPQYPAP
jgi:hypothetical protein